ncbi:MAG TPA: SMP-30/gluconolactonase/LRE family protein [Gemmatimonadales bacterium]|nr:SMP-30/gluconolactonase/LRE family protein [Gemmatimonadales bacterium]
MNDLVGRGVSWVRRRLPPARFGMKLHAATPALRNLVDLDSGLERLKSGFGFLEGPVWIAQEAALLFSDIPGDRIFRWTPSGLRVFRQPSRNANGLTRDGSGRLLACEHGARRVTRTEPDGSLTVLADRYAGQPLNSPNDLVEGPSGAIYFTDPPYGIRPSDQRQSCQGVYRIGAGAGEPELLVADFDRPNGLAFSPDQRRLYVADSSARRHLRAFKVDEAGNLSEGRVFLDMSSAPPGVPDGLKVDQAGNLYCTGPLGIWVIDPNGTHLGTIALPEEPANCGWGDADWCSLFITAGTGLYRLRTRIPGVPVGPP